MKIALDTPLRFDTIHDRTLARPFCDDALAPGGVESRHDVRAAVIAPSLVSVRSIVLGPVGSSGPRLEDDAVIPESRAIRRTRNMWVRSET